MNRAMGKNPLRVTAPNGRYRTPRPDMVTVTGKSPGDDGDEDGEEEEINRALDRIVDFLATYLP
ncbi:MAG: hypothetical protein ACI9TI_000826 [Natronomonas sp.]|jgi:hypothetical protein